MAETRPANTQTEQGERKMANDMNRRGFLKYAAASALGMGALGVMTGCSSKETASSSAASTSGAVYTPGTYTASAEGYGSDVTVTVTWGPAGGTSSEVETARAKALAVLDAEYAKYQAHENYETTITAAYNAGKAAISAATTVDAINTARADAGLNKACFALLFRHWIC